jgi:hypothetical protein
MEKRWWMRLLAARFLGLFLVLAVVACGGGSTASPSSGSGAGSTAKSSGSYAGPAPRSGAATSGAQPAPPKNADPSTAVPIVPPSAQGPKVIRNGQVALEVKTGRFDSAYSSLIALAGEEGGVVSASNASTDSERIKSGTVTLSVPSDHFQDTIDRLRQMGTVQQLNLGSQDVSQQYVDLEARLANAQAERDAMLALLQRAQSIQDILSVQNQLGQYTQQVEQLKGQIDYLDHATTFSTVQVTIRETGVAAPKPPQDEWGLVTALWNGAHAFMLTLNTLIVVLVAAGPYLLVGLLAWLVWRRRRRLIERLT